MSTIIDSRLIGQTIKSLRKKYRLTQSGLADGIGYSERSIRRIENEGTDSIDIINTFARFFNISAMDILKGCSFLTIDKNKPFPTTFLVDLSNSFNNYFRGVALI